MMQYQPRRSNIKILTSLIISALWLAGCASTGPKIYTDQSPTQDFTSYRNFSWASIPPMAVSGTYTVSPKMEQRITNDIKRQLISKGYNYTDDLGVADFAVGYTIGARDRVQVDAYPDVFYDDNDDWSWGRSYYPGPEYTDPFGSERLQYYAYNVLDGSIAIDVYDVGSRQPVWHGASNKAIHDADIEGMKQDVHAIVAGIMDAFPDQGEQAINPDQGETEDK